MAQFLSAIPDSPLITFTLLLLVILTIPPIFERIKLPGLIGLLFAGIVFGSDGLGLLDKDSESVSLLADIGKIYLMFVAGLEIDLDNFRKSKNRSLLFGFCTFFVPLVMGTGLGLAFNMGLNASILIGSLLASHTLLGYPIVNRLGVAGNEAVIITIGATIFTDIGALLVLAICLSIHGGAFTIGSLIIQLTSLAVYSIVVLYGFDRAGKEYFRRTGDEESNQFLFVLLAVFLASVGAQLINVDKIVGAFLAGLAVNDVVGNGPVKEKIEFVGSTLFIPCFFVSIGLLLKISEFVKIFRQDWLLTVSLVTVLIISKFLASLIPKLIYRYNWSQCITMWSLSLPQVAATLAATLAGVNAGLISTSVFNGVIVMMLITSVGGPILTNKFARNLFQSEVNVEVNVNLSDNDSRKSLQLSPISYHSFINSQHRTIIVSVANPQTEKSLVEMACILAGTKTGLVIPLSIVKAHVHMDEPELDNTFAHSRKLLERALQYSQDFAVSVKPIIRIDDDLAEGISRTAKENQGTLIVMGWSTTTTIQARLFGNLIDNVFWSSHCPVAVVKLLDKPRNLRKILIPVKTIELKTLNAIALGCILAETNRGSITLLHVHDRHLNKEQINSFKNALQIKIQEIAPQIPVTIKTLRYSNPSEAIVRTAKKLNFDLVILRSVRRRTAGGLAVSDVTTQVIKSLTCSVIIFGEPH